MDEWPQLAAGLVDGTVPPLADIPPELQVQDEPQDTLPSAPRATIWANLALSEQTAPRPPPTSGVGERLLQHVEGRFTDRATQAHILQGLRDALGRNDAERAAEDLAELLGLDELELVTSVMSDRGAALAAVDRELAQRAAGVGSSADPLQLAPATEEEQYPNVFASGEQNRVVTAGGSRFALPMGTTRVHESYYEEVTVPPSKPLPFRATERLVPLSEMDTLCQGAFRSYESLNRLQSAVYPVAYQSNENMLVCAPTGAGKTDVAMLSVLRCISRYSTVQGSKIHVDRDAFKIVYVAPMKALVSEIVAKFFKRLQYLGIRVRELTGDMQLTRREIAETQMIVTTPEKWDVVTRRPVGDGELALSVRLLIIDEVHLLHEDRGAVIETIVARTQRLVESAQTMIRIVGLSATLPNYVDVADFLGVNRWRGLFYFGSSFRPVPLEQHFVGVRGKNGSALARGHLDRVVYEKVLALAEQRHPVMVFVHTRKDTVKTAQALLELGKEDGLSGLLTDDREDTRFDRDMAASRNRELRELYDHGIGIHHAGMLRSDRDLAERTFAAGATRVLCCTATLAWGVNLPAYAVIIKGTDVYNAEAGKFVDLGILDVLQIFGRAGRPQYEDVGVGYICTAGEKVPHYIEAITSSHPIESRFLSGIVDALNAEVALGSVSSVADGVSWLGFTYLYTRLNKAPLVYGIDLADLAADPSLTTRREHWITNAARILVEHEMVVMDAGGRLHTTPVGRIASRYYLHYKTVGIFQERLRNNLREADALDLMSRATDFSQIAMRDSEEAELDSLLDRVPCEVPGGAKTQQGKVNILLQAHISNLYVDDFALVSDMRYIAQNAGRILQSLFDLALDRGYATAAFAFLSLAKAVEHRIWPYEHPLRQMTTLHRDVLHKVTQYADELEVAQIRALSLPDLAGVLHTNERTAAAVHDAASQFPQLDLAVRIRPRPDGHVRLLIDVTQAFVWSERVHGASLPIVVYVEDGAQRIAHAETITLRRRTPPALGADRSLEVDVPCGTPAERPISQATYTVAWTSAHWLGAEGAVVVSLDDVWPPQAAPPTPVLDLPLLALETCLAPGIAAAYARSGITTFNALQTQVFHTLAHATSNVLLCAPIGAGKRTVVAAAVWRERKVWVLVPDAASVEAAAAPLRAHAPRGRTVGGAACDVWVMSPADVPDAAEEAPTLVVVLDVHRMDAAYELAVMRALQHTAARVVATSACLATAPSVAAWLRVAPAHTYTFQPGDAPYPATLEVATVDVAYSEAMVRVFVKPAYDRIQAVNYEPTLLVVSSRAQCISAARELVARLATDASAMQLTDGAGLAVRARDAELGQLLRQGVAVWHTSLAPSDRALVEELYAARLVRFVVVPRAAVYTVPLRAHLVLVLGTQYYVPTDGRGTVAEYPVVDLLQMHALASRPDAPSGGQCVVLCQPTRAAALARQVRQPYVLESGLAESTALLDAVCGSLGEERRTTRDALVAWLGTSLLSHRIAANPVYYGVACAQQTAPRAEVAAALSRVVDEVLARAQRLGLVRTDAAKLTLTHLGTAPARFASLAALAAHWDAHGALPDAASTQLRSATADVPTDRDAACTALAAHLPRDTLQAVDAPDDANRLERLLVASWLADVARGAPTTLERAGYGALAPARARVLWQLLK